MFLGPVTDCIFNRIHSLQNVFLQQSSVKKVFSIVIPLFLLGGSVIYYCNRKSNHRFSLPYSPICQAARKTVEDEIRRNKPGFSFSQVQTLQDIEGIVYPYIFIDSKAQDFLVIMRNDKHALLTNEEQLNLADLQIKKIYTLTSLLIEVGLKNAREEKQDIYHYFNCNVFGITSGLYCRYYQMNSFFVHLYHLIRAGKEFDSTSKEWSVRPLTQGLVDPFYQEGTVQNGWREMYNDICDRLQACMPVERREERYKDCSKYPLLLYYSNKDLDKDTFVIKDDSVLQKPGRTRSK